MSFDTNCHNALQHLGQSLPATLHGGEQFTLHLQGEDSTFTRCNRGLVRQTGQVRDARYQLHLFAEGKTSWRSFAGSGDPERDLLRAQQMLTDLRAELAQLPIDPYAVLPSPARSSSSSQSGQMPPDIAAIMAPAEGTDLAGLYAGGQAIRGYADSAGSLHWFSTATFTWDYSLFDEAGRAVKGTYAGRHWDGDAYRQQMATSRQQLQQLQRPFKNLDRGRYRTYLAPAAVADLVGMLSWGGVSEASLQQGQSALAGLRTDRVLSPLFSLTEDFSSGVVPRFNNSGAIAPESLPIIDQGQLVNTLVSDRTAQEYGLVANGANDGESLRSPRVTAGDLAEADILARLDRGLYLSNLHYLNWSDRSTGRVTGMTRYACFWVEDGEIVAPISNLRFDDSLYDFWGDRLLAVTNFTAYIAAVDSYGGRSLGGSQVPGMLIDDFVYTL
jgi:predicted Zn-dependent protease